MDKEAATHNSAVLAAHNQNLTACLSTPTASPTQPGSEFRPCSLIAPILAGHPHWPRLFTTLWEGADYPLAPIADTTRMASITAALEYGNHRSACALRNTVVPMLASEIAHGFQLPILLESIRLIPGAVLAPCGIASQETITETGERVPKYRLTHDQSFPFPPCPSFNARILLDRLSRLRYGTALRRFLHMIVASRHQWPTIPLLMAKLDWKTAYQHIHLVGPTAAQSIISTCGLQDDPMGLVALCVTFGGSPGPSVFSELSETVTDLSNALCLDPTWTPGHPASQFDHLIACPPVPPATPAMAQARPLSVPVAVAPRGCLDVFIDDMFSVAPALPESHMGRRPILAALLAIDTIGRPSSKPSVIPREPVLSITKAIAEGTPAERIILLGWVIDSRRLTNALPPDKHFEWRQQLWDISTNPRPLTRTVLETLVGRLGHVASARPVLYQFLGRLRQALALATRLHCTRLSIN
jgi:hypothetical protein